MGGKPPLASWLGASLALHLLVAAAWLAAPPAPPVPAQARLLAVEILDGGETPASRDQVQPAGDLPTTTAFHPPPVGRASARPTGDQTTATDNRPSPADQASPRQAEAGVAYPPAVRATAPLPAPDTRITERLQAQLLERLAEQLRYPPLARARGWEGVVVMQLRLEANGDISRLRVLESSGYPLLDRAASQGLQRVARVPQAIAWLQGEAFDLVLPVQYRLIDL